MTVAELKAFSQHLVPRPEFAIAKLAREMRGVDVVFLPVGHPELNPIELAWAQIKGYVRRHHMEMTQASATAHVKLGIQTVSAENWKKLVEHVIKIEDSWMVAADSDIFSQF